MFELTSLSKSGVKAAECSAACSSGREPTGKRRRGCRGAQRQPPLPAHGRARAVRAWSLRNVCSCLCLGLTVRCLATCALFTPLRTKFPPLARPLRRVTPAPVVDYDGAGASSALAAASPHANSCSLWRGNAVSVGREGAVRVRMSAECEDASQCKFSAANRSHKQRKIPRICNDSLCLTCCSRFLFISPCFWRQFIRRSSA